MIPILKKRLGRFGGAVSIPTVEFTHEKNGTFEIDFQGAGTIYVDPGDSDPVEEFDLSTNPTFDKANDGTSRTVRITGDLLGITQIKAENNNITSTLSSVGKLKNLTLLWAHNNSIPGDLSFLDNLLSLNNLYIANNLFSCDMAPVFNLESMGLLRVFDNDFTYSQTSWPAWDGGLYNFASTLKTSGEVDQMLIYAAAGGVNNTTLYLDGTNPARTAASDDDVATLTGNNVILHLS